MTTADLADTLTREHHEIDAGIEEFSRALDDGTVSPEPLHRAFAALRRHIYLEEELLFPPIRRAGLMMPLLVMTREHGELWRSMDALEELVGTVDSGPGPVLAACRELLAGLDQHNSKEEPIIYPHAATDLSAEETAVLAGFIETGTIPSGWLCEAVR